MFFAAISVDICVMLYTYGSYNTKPSILCHLAANSFNKTIFCGNTVKIIDNISYNMIEFFCMRHERERLFPSDSIPRLSLKKSFQGDLLC